MSYYEKSKRSLVKTITFRIVVTTADFFVIYWLTGKWEAAAPLVILTNLDSTVLYFLHERIWNKIHWGKRH